MEWNLFAGLLTLCLKHDVDLRFWFKLFRYPLGDTNGTPIKTIINALLKPTES